MDLSEIRGSQVRHPWETARAVAIERILRDAAARPTRVLDYGCGDGFTGERVMHALGARELVGFDIHLTDEQCAARSSANIQYENDWSRVGGDGFDLSLLCDVIEHVADDRALLQLVHTRLNDQAQAMVTVPAFQSLFTKHDRALKHFRRYTLSQLESAVTSSGFEVVSSGYLFASLLAGRGLAKVVETMKRAPDDDNFGIGAWNGSAALTRSIETVLNLDNTVLVGLASRGIKLPGLSAWVLCNKRRS